MNFLNFQLPSRLVLVISCGLLIQTNSNARAASNNMISKIYYIKGMTCGGCAFQINKALEGDLSSIQYAEKKITVGAITLTFKNENYNGTGSDCKVKESIEGKTEYKIYADEKHEKPVCSN